MSRIAKHLIAAGGKDGRVSRKDAATKIATLAGSERALVDTFFDSSISETIARAPA